MLSGMSRVTGGCSSVYIEKEKERERERKTERERELHAS